MSLIETDWGQDMRNSRVILLCDRSIFSVGVHRLLQESDDLDVSRIPTDDPEWVRKVKQLRPQVIVMASNDKLLDQEVVIRLLDEHPRTRVITLKLNDGSMDVYFRKRVVQAGLNGLREAISWRLRFERRS